MFHQRFDVSFEYPVIFTRDVFAPGNPVLRGEIVRLEPSRPHRMAVFVDSGVAAAWPDLCTRIEAYVGAHADRLVLVHPPRVVPGGETIKADLGGIRDLMHQVSRWGLCRHSYVMAVGGGAVLDAVGFCASLVHRGLRMVRVPTTVLAQDDAGVGVKTGIDTDGGKNTAGTFAPPFAVLNDLDFLRTLSDLDWVGGAAEAFKVAILKDRAFFDYLCEHAAAIPARDEGVMERLVVECARLHLDHIRTGGDPFESGAARPLDFGHWAAHQLESMSGYRIRHGQAVAAGVALDSCYARAKGWLDADELATVLAALERAGFPLWYPESGHRGADGSLELLEGLRNFREHLGGELCVTFPDGIGSRREAGEMDTVLIESCLGQLRDRASPSQPLEGRVPPRPPTGHL